jgi:hypothetical protein
MTQHQRHSSSPHARDSAVRSAQRLHMRGPAHIGALTALRLQERPDIGHLWHAARQPARSNFIFYQASAHATRMATS